MDIGRHAKMELGNPDQAPGRHRAFYMDKGFYGWNMGRRDMCDSEYYLFEVVGERDNNDPNTRK